MLPLITLLKHTSMTHSPYYMSTSLTNSVLVHYQNHIPLHFKVTLGRLHTSSIHQINSNLQSLSTITYTLNITHSYIHFTQPTYIHIHQSSMSIFCQYLHELIHLSKCPKAAAKLHHAKVSHNSSTSIPIVQSPHIHGI